MAKQNGINIPVSISSMSSNESLGFSLEANDKPINLHFENAYGTVFLVIDTSGSMSGNKLTMAKTGWVNFAKEAVLKDYLVGLASFSTDAKYLCDPTNDVSKLNESINYLNASGSTNMVAGINIAMKHLESCESPRAMIIATDGVPDSVQGAINAGQKAKLVGIDIITIGTDDADQEFLKKLASGAGLPKKVRREMLAEAITDTVLLLQSPKRKYP
jgi:Mg-chelatase subunit ChlD